MKVGIINVVKNATTKKAIAVKSFNSMIKYFVTIFITAIVENKVLEALAMRRVSSLSKASKNPIIGIMKNEEIENTTIKQNVSVKKEMKSFFCFSKHKKKVKAYTIK